MLVRHKILGLGERNDGVEKRASDVTLQQPVAVFGKRRCVPNGIIRIKPDKPTEQNVIVELLDQEPLAANAIKYLQKQRTQQALWWNRRTSVLRVQWRKSR